MHSAKDYVAFGTTLQRFYQPTCFTTYPPPKAKERSIESLRDTLATTKRTYEGRLSQAEAALAVRDAEVGPSDGWAKILVTGMQLLFREGD